MPRLQNKKGLAGHVSCMGGFRSFVDQRSWAEEKAVYKDCCSKLNGRD